MGLKTEDMCEQCYTPSASKITRRNACGNRVLSVSCTFPRTLKRLKLFWGSRPYENIWVARINKKHHSMTRYAEKLPSDIYGQCSSRSALAFTQSYL